MKTPHKHAELIKAWADGAEIEYFNTPYQTWEPIFKGWSWDSELYTVMRIKPNNDTKEKYLYLNWQDGENKWFITAAPFQCTKFKFKVEQV